MPSLTTTTEESTPEDVPKALPEFGASGRKIIYKDGKPCRTCNTLMDFQFATGKSISSSTQKEKQPTESSEKPNFKLKYPKEEPPDVSQLGKSSWTLLHSIAATYPETPTTKQQTELKQFINLFSGFYPCWYCGEDFKNYIKKNQPKTQTQEDFGKWLCDAHNDVNKKLGKPQFNCQFWKQRWKDGWEDNE
ncbi:ERV1 [Candida jiufengensis]|uniref:ERV1 n=1 Tax=Candida jiufengensis TaxID=497108 RepID=UPI002225AB9B|nr:ERV1 [Candida jiufengensis]KAI5950924.1 ERV1 [Candida jiufengensis]